MSFATNVTKKRRCSRRGRLIKGLSPHVIPPSVSAPPATSTPVPAVQSAGLNIGRLQAEVSNHLSLGLGTIQAPLLGRSKGCSLPAPQLKVTFGIVWLGDTGKCLREEVQLPPRLSPRAPNPRTREEWGIQEAASLPASTGGQPTN